MHKEIVEVHHPKIKQELLKDAMEIFFDVRSIPGLKKKPSTSELIDWLKLLLADDIPEDIYITGEQILLEQAIGNVIDNAISFSPEGKYLDIEVQQSNRNVFVKIRDEGKGIPGYADGKIFTRFYSTVNPDSKRRSNGLGLRFVKKIMELHSGQVTLKNRIMKKGAEATLKFSIKKANK